MNKKYFDTLFDKYLNDSCNANEKEIIDSLLELIGDPSIIKKMNYEEVKNEIWAQIEKKTFRKKSTNYTTFYRVAASFIVFIGLGILYYYLKPNDIVEEKIGLIKTVNTSKIALKISLSDGSQVTISPKSSLTYPINFNKDLRVVTLNGKGFFEIAKNPNKPFIVYSNHVVTKVLGTSFWIEPDLKTKGTKVVVITGKVTVSENLARKSKILENNKRNDGVVLTANQKVTFIEAKQSFISGIVDNPIPLNQEIDNDFKFNDMPLKQVLEAYELKYGINIEVEKENLLTCPLTANLTNESFYTALDIICSSINAKYEIKGINIVIYGKGCK